MFKSNGDEKWGIGKWLNLDMEWINHKEGLLPIGLLRLVYIRLSEVHAARGFAIFLTFIVKWPLARKHTATV